MMDGREAGRRETDAGLQCLWWFHVHRGLCVGGALGRLALTPEGSECPLAVCYSGAPSALDTLLQRRAGSGIATEECRPRPAASSSWGSQLPALCWSHAGLALHGLRSLASPLN